jgi:toxin ParE1/3/4
VTYTIEIIIDAEDDLWEIYRYVARNDSIEKADRLIDNIEKTIVTLEILPFRGNYPPELERIGVLEFREVFFKPYRIIYQIMKSIVYVHCILDGRRDLPDLLQNRLLR